MIFVLANAAVRQRAADYCIAAPEGHVVQFSEPVKSREQEMTYHALIGEIADTRELYGRKIPPESWKRLLIDAFRHDTITDPELSAEWAKFGSIQLVPALNHPGFVMVGEQSRRFTKKLGSAFITWLQAFHAGA